MKISAKTDIGKWRKTNQDSYAIGELPNGGAWAVVCDGMGGHAGGNIASKIAADTIESLVKENFREGMPLSSMKNMLESAIVSANAKILDRSEKEPELVGMGTTAVAAVCTGSSCLVANVGDSRCYKLSGGCAEQITKDHSLVQEMVDAGLLTPEEAQTHSHKNIITRALGIEEDIAVDFFETTLSQGDSVLLCSDGLTNHADDQDLIDCTSDGDVFHYANRLVEVANQNGGTDNITAVVITV